MNECLKWLAERITLKDLNQEFKYISIENITVPVMEVSTHSALPKGVTVKPVHWFTKEEVIKAQRHLKQKEWISFEESGIPPVGTMLMNWAREKREVVLVCDDHIVCRTFEGKTGYKAYYFSHWESYNLKPWKEKTDGEIAVEKMIEFAHTQVRPDPCIRNLMLGIYKEIKSGKIKI